MTRSTSSPDWYREIDHTGDAGFRVRASTREQLFERAAWAMFTILTDEEDVEPEEERNLTVEGSDLDDLLVRWLSELNFVHVTEHWLFSEFEVHRLTETVLEARVRGEPIDPERHTVYTEIKAVTYHQLSIEETAEGWTVQVIVDL